MKKVSDMEQNTINMGRRLIDKPIHLEALDTLLYFEFNDSFQDRPESHPAWEMIYADRGSCTVVADEQSFTLEQGELYFHQPFERHLLQIPKGEFPNIFICSFHCSSPAMQHLARTKLRVSLSVKQQISAIISEATQTFELSDRNLVIQGILFKGEDKLWAGEQSIFLRMELMLIDLLREHAFQSERKSRFLTKELASDPLCCRVIEFLEEHIYEKPDMDELCRRLSFSRSYISKRFSRICGIPLSRYFNQMKIEEAKRLIRETRLSFFEISERLMLSNSHYFSTLFQQFVGMTPTQYKQSCK